MESLFQRPAIRSISLPGMDKWEKVRASILRKRVSNLRQSDLYSDLQTVNKVANAYISYTPDSPDNDYWATVEETMATRKGDCEDIAVVKMSALIDMGYTLNQMALAVVQNRTDLTGHAILVFSYGDLNLILDMITDAVMLDTEVTRYIPAYAYSEPEGYRYG